MSTINAGGKGITDYLVFALDGDLSVSYVKTPRQLSGCILWLDADDLSTISTESGGRNVRYWTDKSDSKFVLTGGGLTLANEPLSVIGGMNGRNTIRCDGGDYLSCPFTTTYTEFTIFYVFNGNETYNSRNHILSINNGSFSFGNNNFELNVNDNYGSAYQTMWVYWNGGGSPSSIIGLTSPNTKSDFLQGYPTLFTFSHTNAGSGTNTIYVNGRTRSDQVNTSTQTITIGGGSHTLYLGVQIPVSLPFKGDICEVIIYNRRLSDTERKQIEQYLAFKWAIPLSLSTSVTNLKDLSNLTTLNAIYPSTYPILQHPYKDVIEQNAYGDYFTFNSSTSIKNIGTGPFTIEWLGSIIARPNGGTNYVLFDNGEVYQTRGVVLRIDGGTKRLYLRFSHGGSPTTTQFYDSPVLVTGVYYHYLISYDGSNVRFYLDGVLTNTVSFPTKAVASTLDNFYPIGSTQCLQGETVYLKIYEKSLTATEVSYQYQLEKNRTLSMPKVVTNNLQLWLDSNYYSSYPNSGTTWFDLTNNTNNFTMYSNQTATAISFISTDPRCFSFNGTSNWMRKTSGDFLFGSNVTVSVWIKITDANVRGIFSNCSGGPVALAYEINGGYMRYQYYSSFWRQKTGVTLVNDGTWKNLVWTKLGTSMVMYINGVADLTTTLDADVSGYMNTIGSNWGPCDASPYYVNTFLGQMASVMYYNSSLTDVEVLQNYNAQKYRFGK